VPSSETSCLTPSDLLSLLFEGWSRPQIPTLQSAQQVRASPGQFWHAHLEDLPVLKYLLLLPDLPSHPLSKLDITPSGRQSNGLLDHTAVLTLVTTIVNSCTAKSQTTLDRFREALSKRARSISIDAIQEVSSLVFVSGYILATIGTLAESRIDNLRESNQRLLECLCSFIGSKDCPEDRLDPVLDVFFVEPEHGKSEDVESLSTHLVSVYTALALNFERRRDALLEQTPLLDDDMMDIDSQVESQTSSHRSKDSRRWTMPRSELAATFDPACRRTSGMVYMKVIALRDAERRMGDPVSPALMDLIKTLSPTELLSIRPVLLIAGKMDLQLKEKDIFELFERLLDVVIQSPTEKSSEVSFGLIIDVMAMSLDLWVTKTVTSLHGLSVDIYEYLTRTALETGTLSDGVQKRLSELLLRIWKRNGDYGQDDKLQSTRTILFGMLEKSSITVKMYLADRIPSIFNLFTLPNHEALFDDIEAILPANLEWIEGIAIRLYILSKLASSWSSLLRKSIYHIFDTAGQAIDSVGYARLGIDRVSRSHAFDGPTAICKTFAPQILYTWLQSHSLAKMPHEVFGYDSLDQLCIDNKIEVFSQLLLLDKKEDMDAMKQRLVISDTEIVQSCFPKAFAYAVSQDTSSPRKTHDVEMRVEKLVKIENYSETIRTSIPSILAQFLISTQTDTAERSFEGVGHFDFARTILSEIKSSVSTERHIAPGMQPSFKGKIFAKQVTILCSRAEVGLDTVFSTVNLTSTIRSILLTAHPALGSLHTYSILKKLRLLISLAGRSALQGYPLESLIRFIKSLVVDRICADDAVSLLRYLFQHGIEYLSSKPSVFYGLGVLSLLSLKTSMEAKPDSLTQESQYKVTMSAVHNIHGWLAIYLLDTISDNHKTSLRLKTMLQAASDVVFPPILSKDEPCALLVSWLLDDGMSNQPILSDQYRRQIFANLLRSAQAPKSSTDFALVDDQSAVKYVQPLCDFAKSAFGNKHISNWVGQVAGVAYKVSGSPTIVSQPVLMPPGQDSPDQGPDLHTSHKQLSASLLRLLTDADLIGVLLTEQALCKMFADCGEAQLASLINLFPAEVIEALQISEQPSGKRSKKTHLLKREIDPNIEVEQLCSQTTIRDWAVNLVEFISHQTPDDVLLTAFSEVLGASEALAVDLMPYVVHLGLMSDLKSTGRLKTAVSDMMNNAFRESDAGQDSKVRLLLRTLVYVLKQPIPQERTILDRQQWLDVGLTDAAGAASRCNMPTTALFLFEVSAQQAQQTAVQGSRRSSAATVLMEGLPEDVLLRIMKDVDDPDAFYGVDRTISFASILDRVDQERDGLKSLMLHSARLDAMTRAGISDVDSESLGTFRALSTLDLNSLTLTLLNQRKSGSAQVDQSMTMLDASLKLDKWDVALPNTSNNSKLHLYQIQESFRRSTSPAVVQMQLDQAVSDTMIEFSSPERNAQKAQSILKLLGTLTEIGDMLSQTSTNGMNDLWTKMQQRQARWDIGR